LQYTSDIRSEIIDNFKKDQFENIFNNEDSSILNDESVDFLSTSNQKEFYENLKKNLDSKTNDYSFKSNLLGLKANGLEEVIEQINQEIEDINKKIILLNNNVEQLSIDILKSIEDINLLQTEINDNQKVLLDYISYIYKKLNLLSDSKNIDGLKTVLMKADNLNEVLSDLYYSSLLEVTGQTLIEEHRILVKKTFLKKIELENLQKKLNEDKKQIITDKKSVIQKKSFREKLLEYTNGQQEVYKNLIETNNEIELNLKRKILHSQLKIQIQKNNLLEKYNCKIKSNSTAEYDGEIDFQEDYLIDDYLNEKQNLDNKCENLSKILENELKIKNSGELIGNFNYWPVVPQRGLSAYFKDPEYKKVVGSEHDAIDIRVNQGTDIIAPADGYVIYLKKPDDVGYAYVALKHNNNIITVYGHINELLVDHLDYIKAGEVFAKTGGEYGTNGAGIMTTGPHLHMEVFKNREIVDPLDYLDLTILGENNIPNVSKIIYKFMDDFRENFGERYEGILTENIKLFRLDGETEVDRQKDLLIKYATPDFRNWDIWIEESVFGNIDPSFIMCVGLAESGLGRNLKTPYNVG
ncbi:MAG: peptidoglycan DD-metalloendopeptidase family protein, partial [Candidatus Gracilibacteria bacterium]|nr:peptidoglycan DD-metalloendopeptidase family protein [Candidatus Gracilibacteria bacterium]